VDSKEAREQGGHAFNNSWMVASQFNSVPFYIPGSATNGFEKRKTWIYWFGLACSFLVIKNDVAASRFTAKQLPIVSGSLRAKNKSALATTFAQHS